MAYAYVDLKNENEDHGKKYVRAPVGFSWTGFLFGYMLPIYRQKVSHAIYYILACFILGFALGLIGGLLNLTKEEVDNMTLLETIGFLFLFGAFYNYLYIKSLMKKGYIPYSACFKNSKKAAMYDLFVRCDERKRNCFKLLKEKRGA